MKKLTWAIIVIFLISSFSVNAAIWHFDYKNISDSKDIIQKAKQINWTDGTSKITDAHVNFGMNKSEVALDYQCDYWGGSTIPSSYTATAAATISTDIPRGGTITDRSIKIVRTAGAELKCSVTSNVVPLSYDGFIVENATTTGNGMFAVDGVDVYSRYGIDGGGIGGYIRAMNKALQGSNTNIRESHSFIWAGIYTNSRLYINNGSVGGFWGETANAPANHQEFFDSLDLGDTHYLTIHHMWNNSAVMNTTANMTQFVRNVTDTARNAYTVYAYAPNGESSNFILSLSCNNGTNWVNSTNASTFNCLNSQSSHDFIVRVYGNFSAVFVDAGYTSLVGIASYNVTSEGGTFCTNWNTDKSNACVVNDTTPTIEIVTNQSSYCAIGVSDSNYSVLGSSRECSGGQRTTQHVCTLTSQDEMTYENSYVFIGCGDPSRLQNTSSTSGGLRLNITGIESTARGSIEKGIKNALTSDYALYTDQKIYARDSANKHTVGGFDKVTKKLSKIWAFNRIGATDNLVNMSNITPVLYTLEFSNKTSVYIENQTALLINATK